MGMTVKIVSHVEFAVGAGGAQGGCEDPGLRGQLPPGPLQGQEVPWDTAGLLRADFYQRPSEVRRAGAGPSRDAVPGSLLGASPVTAPRASVPRPLPSWAGRRPHCSCPTLASSQPPASGDSKSVVPATVAGTEWPRSRCLAPAVGRAWRKGAPPTSVCPLPHSCSSSPPPHCCWKSHSCSGGTHRSPQERCPGSQKSWGCRPGG